MSLGYTWKANNSGVTPNPVYLGVTLDRILSYLQHLTKTAGKLQSRYNLLMKLAGSSWGANANTLRSSVLALCYSVAEYCCPEWQRSTHVSLVDSNCISPCTSSLAPSGQLHYHGCPFSQILNHQLYDADLPQTS